MNEELRGRVAVVTGAGQGVGRGIARRLAREGVRVLVAEINRETGAAVAAECTALGAESHFVPTDVLDRASVEATIAAALARFGALDILVNNAYAAGPAARLQSKPEADFRLAMEGSFFAALWAMQAAFAPMRTAGRGRIINLCTLNGVNAHPFSADYNSSKEALRALTRSAAREWAPYGITVNAICPAAVTPAYERFRVAAPELAAKMLEQNPMGYMGDAEDDIGGVAAFLASDAARYLTGNTLLVDGGSHLNGVQWAPPVPPDEPPVRGLP
jgi:NAD(P)-dependent dehydrogenase (short-subunit alcohol dehydrogenase family)